MTVPPKDKKAEILKRVKKQEEIAFAEKIHKENREKAYISEGGVSQLAKEAGKDESFVGKLHELKEKVQTTKRFFKTRGRDFFGGGSRR